MRPSTTAQVALRTSDRTLAEQVRRLTDLAGLVLVVVPEDRVPPAAPVVLDDGGDGTVAVRVADDPSLADLAGGATVRLPEQEAGLLDLLVTAGTPHRAVVVGVVGAHGGAGASVLAAALARVTVRSGAATALVDLDPAGGLDVLLGLERDPGRRWADVRDERGALLPEQLALALPTWNLVRVLAGDRRGGVGALDLVTRSAVRALGQGHDVVVLDLPRHALEPGPAQDLWLGRCDHLLVVTTAGVRGQGAAAALRLGPAEARARLVVRRRPGETDESEPALPVAARMRDERALAPGIERGAATPGDQRRGHLVLTARTLAGALGLTP